MGEIVVVRHGQTEWSAAGRHTSHTDLELTGEGEWQAMLVGERLRERGENAVAVLSSPRKRALRTAELAGLTVTEVSEDLAEWNYGRYEGVTTETIHETDPDWWLWTDGAPGGESPEQVAGRLDRVLAQARTYLKDGDVVLVGHGHALRMAGARWLGLPPEYGGRLRLGTATISILGFEHGREAISTWNT